MKTKVIFTSILFSFLAITAFAQSKLSITKLTINGQTIENPEQINEFRSSDIIVFNETVNISAQINTFKSAYGLLWIDFNRNNELDEIDLLTVTEFNKEGYLEQSFQLNPKQYEMLLRTEKPFPLHFKVSDDKRGIGFRGFENEEDDDGTGQTATMTVGAIGPIIVVDSSEGDAGPGTKCVLQTDNVLTFSITNKSISKVEIVDIIFPTLAGVTFTLNRILPDTIDYNYTTFGEFRYYDLILISDDLSIFYNPATPLNFQVPIDITYRKVGQNNTLILQKDLNATFCEYGSSNGRISGISTTINQTDEVKILAPIDWAVSPNPASDEMTINYSLQETTTLTIQLMSLNGSAIQTIMNGQEKGAGYHRQTLNLSDLPQGMYFVAISSKHGNEVKKIVKR